ncbi:hypothetical protein HFD88_006833 [Aspergillus terreus]|nr:hypothetical protein HFD88_006833 [Aspergillus terreus]
MHVHIHIATLTAVLATLTPVLANDVVTLLIPVVDDAPVVVKLLGSQGQMTSYRLDCPSSMTESCFVPPEGYTIAQGPSSLWWRYSAGGYCVATLIDGDHTQVTREVIPTDKLPYHRATVIATETQDGAATAVTASATTKNTPSVSSATATATATGATTGVTTAAASATGTNAAAATHTTSHNAAMAWATATPMQWVVGGAAMGVVLAMV